MNFVEYNFSHSGSMKKIPIGTVVVRRSLMKDNRKDKMQKHYYVLFDKQVTCQVIEGGYDRVRVFFDDEAKTMCFMFTKNEGQIQGDRIKIQSIEFINHIAKFFNFPPMNNQDTLFISKNQSHNNNQLTFHVRQNKFFEKEF